MARGRCEEHEAPGTVQGRCWGCCQCNTANLDMARTECRYCGHARCDVAAPAGATFSPWLEGEAGWLALGLDNLFLKIAYDTYDTGGEAAEAALQFANTIPEARAGLLDWIVGMDWPTWKATIERALPPHDTARLGDARWWMFVRSFRLCCERIKREAGGERMGGAPEGFAPFLSADEPSSETSDPEPAV